MLSPKQLQNLETQNPLSVLLGKVEFHDLTGSYFSFEAWIPAIN
jgi:hypothetical protein